MSRPPTPLAERFATKVSEPDDKGCRRWLGKVDALGRGRIWAMGKSPQLAHRVAWELERGPIPDGLLICHKCDVYGCLTVEHMFLGSHQDNVADRVAKNRTRQGHVPLRSGEHHGCAKVTWEIVEEMRRRHALGGVTMAALGYEFGISKWQARNIIKRRHWTKPPAAE